MRRGKVGETSPCLDGWPEGVALPTVGDDAMDRGDSSSVAPGADDALENPEGLEWASMGLWTDVAIKSDAAVLESTVTALSEALKEEEEASRKDRRDRRIESSFSIIGTLVGIGLAVSLIATSSMHARTVLSALLGVILGSVSFSLGLLINRTLTKRQKRREGELVRRVLTHELGYKQRIANRGTFRSAGRDINA